MHEEKTVSPQKARQGLLGLPVLVVLVTSLTLGVIYLVGMLVWGDSQTESLRGPTPAGMTSRPPVVSSPPRPDPALPADQVKPAPAPAPAPPAQ